MPELILPAKKRVPPKPMIFLGTFMYYLLAVPIDWILKKVFRTKGLYMFLYNRRKMTEAKLLEVFADYSPTGHDVFVATFSKSGTNWTLQMAHQIAFLGEGEFANIHDVVPWPDFPAPNADHIILSLDDKLVQQASPTHLRVIKSHLSAKYVPYAEQARYISVIRDPKDIFVSSYFFAGGMFGSLMPSMEDWLEAFLSDDFPLSFGVTWAQHTASYWALHDRPNVLILSFKAMKNDLPGTVNQVAEFLGVALTEPQFKKIVEKCSFDYMKAIDDSFLPLKKKTFPWMTASMVRSGKEGNSNELLTIEQQQRIDEYFIGQLRALGSDFRYADFCRMA